MNFNFQEVEKRLKEQAEMRQKATLDRAVEDLKFLKEQLNDFCERMDRDIISLSCTLEELVFQAKNGPHQ